MATRQVALLRGINLGRSRRIAMADLRKMVSALGYADVSTHMQSGNVVLSTEDAPDVVARAIESAIARETSFDVSVLVRTRAEMDGVVADNPLADVVTDPARLLVAFLSIPPERSWLDAAGLAGFDTRLLGLGAAELYIWCPDGILASPIPDALSKVKHPGLVATSRNWRTVIRLHDMLHASGAQLSSGSRPRSRSGFGRLVGH